MASDTVQSGPPGSSPTAGADDPQVTESAREVMRAFTKAVKSSKMYLPEHEICRRFREEFCARLLRHLEEWGDLPLTVRGYEFYVGATPVYEESNRFENLAFRCSSEGLSKLVFHEGLTREELDRVIDALTAESRPLDSDIVTRLWESALPHVSHEMAEVDDAESGEPVLSSLPPSRRTEAGGTESPTAPATNPDPELALIADLPTGDHGIVGLTDEEISLLKDQVAEDVGQDYVEQLIDILASILALDDDEQSFLEVLQVLDDVVATCIRQGRFARARDVVVRLLALRDGASLSERSRELIRVVWSQLGRWERVAVFEDVLNKPGAWDRGDVASYLATLPPAVVGSLITLLERVQAAKGRRLVCDALAAFGEAGVEMILERLPGSPWYVARNLIYVLGAIKDARALPALEQAMKHAEARIRREALKALEAIGGPALRHALPGWVGDPDEGVRLHVLKLARQHRVAEMLPALAAMIADRGFDRRSETEQREFFETLVDVGSDAALPLIRPWLTAKRTWPWIWVSRHDSRAKPAISAVRRLGSPAARDLLRDAAARGRGVVGEDARRALRELERVA